MVDEFLENQPKANIEKNIIFLKGRFKSKSLNLYGLFIVVFTPNGQVESYNCVVSTFSNVFGLEPHQNWDKFEESIINFRWRGNFNNSMTSSLLKQIEAISNDNYMLNQLFNFVNDYDYNHAEIFLFDTLNKIIQDKNLLLEIGIQEVSRKEIALVKEKVEEKSISKKSNEEKNKYRIEEGATLLTTSLILAPVRGKPLYELKIGDKIMLKIEPVTEQSNYFIDYYELRSTDRIKPIPAEVIDIKSDSKNSPIEILSRIDDGLYGKSIEEERQVKLRIYDPRYDGTYKHINKKEQIPNVKVSTPSIGMSAGTLILISAFGIIVILLLAIIYILM